MEIGKAIRTLRLKRGISQRELAKRLGRTETMVSLMESGKNIPQTERIKDVSKALGVTPTFLFLYAIEKSDIPEDKQLLYDTLLVPLRDNLAGVNEETV